MVGYKIVFVFSELEEKKTKKDINLLIFFFSSSDNLLSPQYSLYLKYHWTV